MVADGGERRVARVHAVVGDALAGVAARLAGGVGPEGSNHRHAGRQEREGLRHKRVEDGHRAEGDEPVNVDLRERT